MGRVVVAVGDGDGWTSAHRSMTGGWRPFARARAFLAAGTFVTPDLGETILSDPRLAALRGGVNTPEELRLLVRVNLDRGVDVIKTRGTERAADC